MKRVNGTGTIVKLSGARRRPFAVRLSERDKYGYIKQRALSYHATSKDAQQALDEYNRHLAAGTAPAPDKLSTTVRAVYEGWSGREYKRLKPASVSSHKAAWRRISRFEDRKMRDVTLDEWQSILDDDEEKGFSQSLINNDAILIKALFSYSMERDIVGKDYSQFLAVPAVGAKKKKGAFSDFQIKKLEDLVSAGFPWADTVLMMCYTGLRITEFLTLTPFSYHPEHGGYLQCGIKTQAGRDRIIPIHPKVMPLFKRWLRAGGDTIISKGGVRISKEWYREAAFRAVAKELGVPEATPHWCRHTFATRLYAANVEELTIKRLLGHSTKKNVTSKYIHDSIEMLEQAVRKLA